MQAIPISTIVSINPGVVGAGGNPLALNGVFVSSDVRIPVGSLVQFSNADDVADFFGIDSEMSKIAQIYFLSFDNSQKKPGAMIFAPYCMTARSPWIRGRSIAGMTLNAAKAVTGDLSVTIAGQTHTADAIDLSQCSSFSDIASALTEALDVTGATISWDSMTESFNLSVTAQGSTASISAFSGTVADGLGLSAGVVSQGANSDTPETAMERIKAMSLNWATFTVVESGVGDKEEFATWTNAQNRRYLYVPWDNDQQALVAGSNCFAATCKTMKWEAVLPVFDNVKTAAFVLGSFASVDWNAENGRIDLSFKSQSGLAPIVTTRKDFDALKANGYSFYGLFAAQGDDNQLNMFYNGQLPGSSYKFSDTFVNQIFLNSQLQLAIATGLMSVRAVPYNATGYATVRAWCSDPISQAVKNGTIRVGVSLSQAQKATIISTIGKDVSDEIFASGYYLKISDADAQTRSQRQSPPITLFYTDGGSIQQIDLDSIVII